MDIYDNAKRQWNEHAQTLASEGRAKRFNETPNLTREEWDENQVRLAFLRIQDKNVTQAGRDMTEEAMFVDIFKSISNATRANERERLTTCAIAVLQKLLGDDAVYSLISELADALGLER